MRLSIEKADEKMNAALEDGWRPARYEEKGGCSCNINSPCSWCCTDDITDDDLREYCDEVGIEII